MICLHACVLSAVSYCHFVYRHQSEAVVYFVSSASIISLSPPSFPVGHKYNRFKKRSNRCVMLRGSWEKKIKMQMFCGAILYRFTDTIQYDSVILVCHINS